MKVLIATDGSEYSMHAVKEFCRLFPNRSSLQMKVVSAYEELYVAAAAPYPVTLEYNQRIADSLKDYADHSVASAAEVIQDRDGNLHVGIETIKGHPEKEIVEMAKDWGADLIVVGSHGRGFFGRMLGSVSDAVVHHAPCSVLVIRKPSEG